MLDTFLITSRETLEASLVIGIVLSYLSKTDNNKYKKSVYYGIGLGILASILAAFIFNHVAGGFSGRSEQIFEGVTMLLGAFLLSTMILWMMKQRHIANEIEKRVHKHISKPQPMFSYLGIFLIIFIAIIREGVETVIFLNAIKFADGINLLGGLIGIFVAILIGYLFFMSTKKINLKKLFKVSSILLILFAAGLVAHGVHELEEAKILNPIIYPLYDINPEINIDGSYPVLHEKGLIGSFLKGLFGYNGNPSLLEVISYLFYLAAITFIYYGVNILKIPRQHNL
tara:strand:+ start:208 stop:1062 length:855 start_codon:yes stop_codon:yes gene_type:complete